MEENRVAIHYCFGIPAALRDVPSGLHSEQILLAPAVVLHQPNPKFGSRTLTLSMEFIYPNLP